VRQHDERDLRAALREEADRHRPNRAAMLNRVAHGRSAPARRPFEVLLSLLRPVAAAVAVAVVLVLAVAGVRLSNRGPEVDDTPVAAPTATPAPATSATTAPEPSATPSKPTRTTTSRAPATPATPATPVTAADRTRDGFLDSAGELDPHSNDGWSQQNVELKTGRTLTAVDVTVTVALTPGVVETGRFTTVPTHMVTMTTSRSGKNLVYRFTLQPGFTLAPGKYTFAAQFNHAAGKRPLAADSYRAEVAGGSGDAEVSGGFTAP
jgi:hypothetical protein